MAKLLFAVIAGAAVALLYYEATIAYQVPWKSPQLLLERMKPR